MKRGAGFLVLVLLVAPLSPVGAAPTCQDRGGNTVRCGIGAAMPLGWTAPEEDRHFAPADKGDVIKALAILFLLLALIGLLPDFEGASWDRQEGDEEE